MSHSFRELHQSGCFVIPNPWDIGSAIYLQHLGFKALATTSAGMAFARGKPDTVTAISRDEMLAHIAEIVKATSLPVNADYQNGYADAPEEVAKNVSLCLATGAAGLSIEDNKGDGLYDRALAIERVKAAVSANAGRAVLTARCEAYLVGHPDPFRTAIDRLTAFAEAGADCLFAPGVKNAEEISAMVKAVAPKPINVLMSAPIAGLDLKRLAESGVRRISVGSALARAAWGGFMRAAKQLADSGSFEGLAGGATFAELNQLFG